MIKILELFGGIGACSKALERLGIDYEIADYVEIDKYAVKSFNAMHGTNFEPQDICKWDKDIEVDLIMHGSPYQDFSVAGLQQGGDEGSGTRSSLMYETIRIVQKLKPKYVIWENVKNVISKKHIHNFSNYIDRMSELGYSSYYQVLNAKDYGIPQNRERVFTISIRKDIDMGYVFPPKQELKLRLKDMLEDNVDEKYYLSDKMINYVCARMPSGSHHITTGINMSNKNEEGKLAGTICTEPGNKPSDNYIIDNDNVIYNKAKGELDYSPAVINVGNVNPSGKGQNGQVVSFDGLARTITIEKGEGQKILIKNNTKKGYLEAYEGDGVYTVTSNKRGTVQPGMIHTITTRQDVGVVVKDNED